MLVSGMNNARCLNCKSVYKPEKYQSQYACARCVPPRNCVHGISNFRDCPVCLKINPNPNMRIMPSLKKTGVVRK